MSRASPYGSVREDIVPIAQASDMGVAQVLRELTSYQAVCIATTSRDIVDFGAGYLQTRAALNLTHYFGCRLEKLTKTN